MDPCHNGLQVCDRDVNGTPAKPYEVLRAAETTSEELDPLTSSKEAPLEGSSQARQGKPSPPALSRATASGEESGSGTDACPGGGSGKAEGNTEFLSALLVPCRAAMKGRFPLHGTYFQTNEVFLNHSSLDGSTCLVSHPSFLASPFLLAPPDIRAVTLSRLTCSLCKVELRDVEKANCLV